jgi:hypothetical protein
MTDHVERIWNKAVWSIIKVLYQPLLGGKGKLQINLVTRGSILDENPGTPQQ